MKKTAILTAAILPLLSTSLSLAQSNAKTGLDSLSEDRVLAELANRQMSSLLDHAFEVNNVPASRREGIKTLSALRELSNPNSTLTVKQRQELIRKVVTGIEAVLPGMNDPKLLIEQANTLLQAGVENDVAKLEYWGENPSTQGSLGPIVETIIKILDKAHTTASERANQAADQIKGPDDPATRRYLEYDNLATIARYTRHMVDYYLVLSIDAQAGASKRETVAADAIEYLSQFDAPDSGVQPIVRNRIAKFHLHTGKYQEAKDLFNSVASGTDIEPTPTLADRHEAVSSIVLADILARDLSQARYSLAALKKWDADNVPADNKDALAVAHTTAAVLEYRVHSLEAELASSPADKEKANQAAVATLLGLVRQYPGVRGMVYEQVMSRLPENADMKTLDPLLLQAIIRRGEQQLHKDSTEPADTRALEQAIAAAHEFVTRTDPAITADLTESAALLIPFFLEKLDRLPEAAGAYLDFIQKFPSSVQNGTLALDNAMVIIGQLVRQQPAEPRVMELYTRFLAIAINAPFNRSEFAYEYARQLQKEENFRDAIRIFRRVPADDKRLLQARFFEMVALNQLLDSERGKLSDTERKQILTDIQARANEVTQAAGNLAASATDTAERDRYRSMIVRTRLLAAKVANKDDNDPKRALELLATFENDVRGLNGETDLLGEALFLRVDSYMDLGQNTQAADALEALLKTREGGQGADIIFGLLQKLDADFEEARRQNNTEEMRSLARARATLSGHLVKWAETNPREEVRKFTYRYRVFDADTRHIAARLETDPAARAQGLREALAKYQALQTPDAVAQYKSTLTNPDIDPNYPDPAVTFGIAKIHFDLGDYKSAQPLFGQLLADKKLGARTKLVDNEPVDNDIYWEATYKLMRCNTELAKTDPAYTQALEETKNGLKRLYIQLGNAVGGRRWKDDFTQLRKEIIPDFQLQDLATPG